MRYAFVSDIHGNLPAWNTVLADLAVHRVDRIVCLGDVVGYGPQPAECLRGVYAHVHQMVLGNHDAVVAGRMSAESFNDRARRMIEWTQTRLGENARALFSSLPLVLRGPGFRCTHGDFADPAVFNYVRTEEDARANFAAVPEQLLFCGHTHEAAVFLTGESGNVYKIEPQDFELEEGKRYLVNVGSVGSARDGDPRASYVIYDEERRGVYFHRVPFDFEAFRAAVAAAPGLDPDLVPFLRAAAARGTAASVREEADFAPAAAVRVEGGAREADVGRALRRTNARLRATALLLAAGCAAALALAAAAWQTLRSHAVSYPVQDAPAIGLLERGGPDGNLLPSFNPNPAHPFDCPPYRVVLSDARVQSVAVEKWIPVLSSSNPRRAVRLSAPAIECDGGTRLEAMCRARFSDDFSGSLELCATLEREDRSEKTLFRRSFVKGPAVGVAEKDLPLSLQARRPGDGWELARGTTDPLPRGEPGLVRVSLEGSFSGRVEIGALSARRRK